jgi:hypothetical protein
VRGRDVGQHGVVGALAAHERAVGLDHHVAGAAPGHDIVAGQPRVDLPLADGEGAAGVGAVGAFEGLYVRFELVEVVEAVVGDAEGADAARLLGRDERVPGAEAGAAAAVGGVD